MCKLTLPLQVGKKYVRKDGKVALCIATERRNMDGYSVVLLVENPAQDLVSFVSADGTGCVADATLVSDYVEPIKDRYVAVNAAGAVLYSEEGWTPKDVEYHFKNTLRDGGRIIKIREVRD